MTSNAPVGAEPGMSLWTKGAIACAVFVAVVVLGVWGWGQVLQAGWNSYAARLRAAGEPLTFLEIDAARPPLPDDQNGALLLNSLPMQLRVPGEEVNKDLILLIGRHEQFDLFSGIPRAMLKPTRSFRDANRDTLTRLQAFRFYAQGRPQRDWSIFSLDIKVPDLSQSRALAKLMTVDTWMYLIDGNVVAATPYPTLTWNLGRVFQDDPLIMSALVRNAIDVMGVRMVEPMLRVSEVSEDTLREWDAQLAQLDAADRMKWVLRGERAFQISALENMAALRTTPADWMSASTPLGNLNILIRPCQRKAAELMTPLIEASDDPVTLMNRAIEMGSQVNTLSR